MRAIRREKPNTLKGKLQRGHGAGYLESLKTSTDVFAPVLIDCICNDARLDQQCESRSNYYASLLIHFQIDIACLDEHLRKHDDIRLNGGNALGVLLILSILGTLAARGNSRAVQILRDYVAYGENWCCAISNLIETERNENLEGIERLICCRYKDDTNLIKSIEAQYWIDKLFIDFMRQANPRLARIADAPNFSAWDPDKHEEKIEDDYDYNTLTLVEAFEICDNGNRIKLSRIFESELNESDIPFLANMLHVGNEYQKALAAYCLGDIGTAESFSHLKDFIEDISLNNPETKSFEQRSLYAHSIRSVINAPAEVCLETGRKWFLSHHYPENVVGQQILEEYATIDDIPMLRRAIIEALKDEEDKVYLLCSAIDALGNFEGIGMIAEVEIAYHESIYSCARRRAAEAMSIHAPAEFSAKYAYECLFDCEDDTKLVGIEYANIAEPKVYHRLTELAEDVLVHEGIRQEAIQRLA